MTRSKYAHHRAAARAIPSTAATITVVPSPTPRSPHPNRHDRLAQGYDHHEAVALGDVPRVDPEARDASHERHAVAHSERHGPERTLGEDVE